MAKVNSGHFIADGSAVNVDVGFVPDLLIAFEGIEETNPSIHFWFRELANTANANGQYGMLLTGSTGVVTKHAAAANGFAEYDTDADGVLVPAPDGDGNTYTSVAGYDATATYTARSTTAVGSVVRPTTRNGYVYECTTASGGASGTEPTWSTTVGGSTTAGSGDVWITRLEQTTNTGAKGFTLGATGSTDSDEWAWTAFKFDKVTPEVDSASQDPV